MSSSTTAGKLGELRIDVEALALHSVEMKVELKRAAAGRHIHSRGSSSIANCGYTRTRAWSELKSLPFMTKAAWVHHDEHYHVDFELALQTVGERAR